MHDGEDGRAYPPRLNTIVHREILTMPRVSNAIYSFKSMLLAGVRVGNRTIIWTPSLGLGFGNHMYLWLNAYISRQAGIDVKVLVTDSQRFWLKKFPLLQELTIERDTVSMFDKRTWGGSPLMHQQWGVDYSTKDLADFVTRFIMPSIESRITQKRVLNVRRGDYYTTYKHFYSFDIKSYVVAALERTDPNLDLLVVSDDVEWCIHSLSDVLPEHTTYSRGDAWENFNDVSNAIQLIGTNSTFSYWGGYIGDVLNEDHPNRKVVMPWFHSRSANNGAAYQLDEKWDTLSMPNEVWLEHP